MRTPALDGLLAAVGFSTNTRRELLAKFAYHSLATLKTNDFFNLARPLH
jgi:hypothetical protein